MYGEYGCIVIDDRDAARATGEAELAVALVAEAAVPAALTVAEALGPDGPWSPWAAVVVFSTASRRVRRFSLVSSEYRDKTR